jgi:predicted amidophosphoribosyltransferase
MIPGPAGWPGVDFPAAEFPRAGFPPAGRPRPGSPTAGFPRAGFPPAGLPRPGSPTAGFPRARPLEALLGLIAPPACAACRAPVAAGAGVICARCVRRLPWLRGHRCPRCALPRHRGGCPAARSAFDRAWAPLAYEGAARDLVVALKFRAALPVAGLMAAHVAANLPRDLRTGPPGGFSPRLRDGAPPAAALGVVAVPPHAGRRRRRGFDPAALLAAGVAARVGLPLVPCLRRADRGRRQVGAGRRLRRSAGRFAAEPTRAPPAAVLLVDDVHTTGATLDACARALKAAGAGWVGAVTYVRTL